MKLKRYLTESITKQEIIEILEKDCKPFISKMGKSHLLLRGSRHSNPDITKMTPRSDRHPMSTSPRIQEILDQLFENKFGWKPRSSSVFCTTVYNTAQFYGEPNSIWPIGNFKFLWSDTITDMFTRVSDIGLFISITSDTTKLEKELKKAVNTYSNKNLPKALNSNSEIMIGCKNYYMVSNEFRSDLERHFKVGFLG